MPVIDAAHPANDMTDDALGDIGVDPQAGEAGAHRPAQVMQPPPVTPDSSSSRTFDFEYPEKCVPGSVDRT